MLLQAILIFSIHRSSLACEPQPFTYHPLEWMTHGSVFDKQGLKCLKIQHHRCRLNTCSNSTPGIPWLKNQE